MFRLSLDALLIIDAIDRRGSFSAAAEELHRVPSTISYSVSKLEQDLNVVLFERNGPKATLTTAGRELLKEGRYLLNAAANLESRVRRVASGWETEFTICIDSLFSPLALAPDISAFYEVTDKTRVRILRESLSGTWEALLKRRADMLVGAFGDGPPGGGYLTEPLGVMNYVFAVSPKHPLASIAEPLTKTDLQRHRAVVVMDSAREMAARTIGLFFGQETLTVPDMHTKYALQVEGLGFGFLPECCARSAIEAGLLVEKKVEEPKPSETFYLAWRSGETGACQNWWSDRFRGSGIAERLHATVSRYEAAR
jgi:DNA-binding transcriptional LysR family regulator